MPILALAVLFSLGAVPQGTSLPSNGARAPGHGFTLPSALELAGKPLAAYPRFRFVRSFNAGEPIHIAFDPLADRSLAKRTVDVYLIAHERLPEHLAGKKLASLTGRPLALRLTQGGVAENTYLLETGTLPAEGRADEHGIVQLGRGYDVVVDVNQNAALDAGDRLDGALDEAGFYVVEDFVSFVVEGRKETGPYPVTEVLFEGGTNQTRQDVYFPTAIAELGAVPLVVVSHGNGHNYTWYDHIGYHLASHGYVVMSHTNNTGPGIETASTTTLRNTEVFLNRLAEIAGGALVGHVDGHRIVWMGHSRGGEGVVRAYQRLSGGDPIAVSYTLADIRLVSSIAPTDFLGVNGSNMGSAPYHLWTGGADSDVNGCADCNICQTFHLLDRADGTRFSTSLHGAGHGDFHDGGGDSVAAGPCRIGRARTHRVMRGTLLPLLQHVLDGNPACLDYLTRQWEEFRALAAPDPSTEADRCATVDLMYVPGPERAPLVLDDFQTEPELTRASGGGAVAFSKLLAPTLVEGRLDDANNSFTVSPVDVMNGMTLAGPGDTARGLVLEWNATDEWLSFELPEERRDLGAYRTLSFRATQSTRDELTIAEVGDLDFTVELTDAALKASAIRLSAYGGGVEEPYLRGTCGQGQGWANEFETIRIPLADFLRDGAPLDLSRVVAVTFRFGPAHGSLAGRIGLDELQLTQD